MSQKKWKGSLFSGLILLLSASFSSLSANSCYEYECCNDYCCRWESCAECGCELHHAQPCCDDCGLFIGGQFLYWTAYQTNLDYAIFRDRGLSDLPNGNTLVVDHCWKPGFRAMLGYRWGCDGWDLRAVYTYFHTNNKDSAVSVDLFDIIPTLVHPSTLDTYNSILNSNAEPPYIESANAKVSLDYDVADVIFSRPFFISQTLILRPFFGVRGVWLNNSLTANYMVNEIINNLEEGNILKSKWRASWEGAGLHAGIEYDMHVCGCLSLYGNFAGSILGGQSKTKVIQQQLSTEGEEFVIVETDIYSKDSVLTALPGLHLGTGISWDSNACGCCMVISLGYEFTHWFNVPRVKRFTNSSFLQNDEVPARLSTGITTDSNGGDLTLHGLTVDINFYF